MSAPLERMRNIGIVAHIDAGKTTTTERVLFYAGQTHRMGEVDEGNTVTDFDPEEQERGITIYSAAVTFEWRGHSVTLIDTPGHVDFTAEVERALRVLDGAVVVIDAKEGAEAQSETVWRQASRYRIARLVFINKMDKLGADFTGSVNSLRTRLSANPLVLQLPIGEEASLEGVIDLVAMRAVYFVPEGDERRMEVRAIPAEMADAAATAHRALIEALADVDEHVMEKFVEGQPLTEQEIRTAVRAATIADKVHPVLCGSSRNKIGVRPLLDAVVDYLPSPLDVPAIEGVVADRAGTRTKRRCDPAEPFAALVFKIIAEKPVDLYFLRIYSGTLRAGTRVLNAGRKQKENVSRLFRVFARRRESLDVASAGEIVAAVGLKDSLTGDTLCDAAHPLLLETIEFPQTVIRMAIEPKRTADHDRLAEALQALARQDPTFEAGMDAETGQLVIGGMGELHLEVLCHRLVRDMHVEVNLGKPRVSYRETIVGKGQGEGRFVRQTGAHPQFAVVRLAIEPLDAAPGSPPVVFESRVPSGGLRPLFQRAVETGVKEAARRGSIAGFPMIHVKATLLGGEENAQDSTEEAFDVAGRFAFEAAVSHAEPRLMEPVMKLELTVPDEHFGAVLGDLNGRRAVVLDTELRGDRRHIQAEVPLREMLGYATAVRSLTQGRASWSMAPLRYEVAPAAVADDIKDKAW